jgi:tRNA (guanine-N(7)-)-methyltransferase subunit TRM82
MCGLPVCILNILVERKLRLQDPQEDDTQEPPGKRIKLSPPKEQKYNFSKLILSGNGQYLVGVTGEDKCIRVFQIDSQNRIHQLSERYDSFSII